MIIIKETHVGPLMTMTIIRITITTIGMKWIVNMKWTGVKVHADNQVASENKSSKNLILCLNGKYSWGGSLTPWIQLNSSIISPSLELLNQSTFLDYGAHSDKEDLDLSFLEINRQFTRQFSKMDSISCVIKK